MEYQRGESYRAQAHQGDEQFRRDQQILYEQLLEQNFWKVSMKCENWRDFRDPHSTQLQEEDWSKNKKMSLNSLARYSFFLTNKKFMENLRNSDKEGVDTPDVFFFTTWTRGRKPCTYFLLGTCTNPSCDMWHPPMCYITSLNHAPVVTNVNSDMFEVAGQVSKKSKQSGGKVQWHF